MVTSFTSSQIGTETSSWVMKPGPNGVLYFGSSSLVSYDGERWRSSPLPGTYAIRSLDFGPDGRLWAAATGEIGWFEQATDGSWKFNSLKDRLPKNERELGEVWHVTATTTGAIFVSAEKIFRWNGSEFQSWTMPTSRRLFANQVGSELYVHHPATGLYHMGPSGPELVISSEVLGRSGIIWMEAQGDGWLLATGRGLFTYHQGHLQPFGPSSADVIRHQALNNAVRLPDGRIALATLAGGIILLRADGAVDRFLTENDGLPSRVIYSVGLDRHGDLWATSSAHVFRIGLDSKSTMFDPTRGLAAHNCRAVLPTGENVFAATDAGVFVLEPGHAEFRPIPSLRDTYFDLLAGPAGPLVAGFHAVFALTGDAVTPFSHSLQDVFVLSHSRLRPDRLLTSQGHSIVELDAQAHERVLVRNLPDIATSIAEGADGNLWLGTTSRGILVARPDASGPVEARRSPLADAVVDAQGSGQVVAAPDGTMVLLGSAGGWILPRGSQSLVPIENYPQRLLAAASSVDPDGAMWVAFSPTDRSGAAVARITLTEARAVAQSHYVEGLEGLGALSCIVPQVTAGRDRVLWIGGVNGLLRNDVSTGLLAPQPRAPVLRALVRSADQQRLQEISPTLPYSTRGLVFEFAAPEYALRPSLRLETRVVGIDDGWIPAEANSRRELTALRDGTYTFQVRAVSATGVASEVTSSKFEILPPWWRTPPVILGALLALAPLGYGSYRLRVRTLQRRNAELEDRVSQRTEQLALASAAKTQFVANMSHDIRNPLNGIVGLALALEETPLDDRQRELVSTLRECTGYLSTLVDDVLDFASIEAGRVELRPGPFSPAELLRSVATTLQADAVRRGATLLVEADPQLPGTLLGDAGRIQQILVNYVSNALKYAGGRIRLSAVEPADAPGEVEFAVTDEGAGISAAEQSTLFTKFHRLADARESTVKGSGLGLAACRALADLMGGSVGVASRPGQGARFHLRLPLAAASAPAPVADGVLPDTSVLVVEDADYNAWAATAVLAKLGLTCERARTGAEALQLFAAKRYNLVLLDRNLPDMDGCEVSRQMRTLEEDGPRAVVLAVTAYCTPEDRALCLQAGKDAFVGKPLTPAKLRKILIAAGRRLLTTATMHVAPKAAALVDLSLLDYISDGTEQGLGDQIERFLVALAEGEARLAQASRSRDYATLGDAAHYVLSQAKLVGSAALEEAAVALERAARAHDAFAFGEMEQRVHREVQAVTAAMRRHRPAAQTA